jgi:hypothetical protein
MIFLFLFVNTIVGQALGNPPNCTYTCDDPICPADCSIKCQAPDCTSNCTSTCSPPVCFTQCLPLAEQSIVDSCPLCETNCLPLQCNPVNASCAILCQAVSCGWVCKKPTNCPQPVCQLNCEQPACESFGIRSGGNLLWSLVFLFIFLL